MKPLMLAVALALSLSACASYQFGDGTKRVLSLQEAYCESSTDKERAIRLAALAAIGVNMPSAGLCADILDLMEG